MLANAPDVDGYTRTNRPLREERSKGDVAEAESAVLPVHRVGLEQEFFLVDRGGALSELADPFLRRCRDAARAEGLDPLCFKAECVKSLVEIATPPVSSLKDLADNYLNNLDLALKVASELGLALYPLGTYPLPISPVVRDDPGYRVKASTIGHGRFSHAGRCAGARLHLELPAGTVWPDVKAALDAPAAGQRELLGLYNLATALDPALVALTRACPYYKGRTDGFAARTVHYRGILGFEGLYEDLHELGGLSAYASRVEDLVDQQRARYRAWFAAMVLAVCALIRGAAERIRHERLEVRPSRGVLALEPDGDLLHVPTFSYLNGELLGAAVTRGVRDQRVEAYLDSIVKFASPYLEVPELVEPLVSSRGYKTTEAELLESFPTPKVSLTREEGLSLVRDACLRLQEQVSSLGQRYGATLPGDERDPKSARVIHIRNSPTIPAEGARPASVHDAQASARAANEGNRTRRPHCVPADRL